MKFASAGISFLSPPETVENAEAFCWRGGKHMSKRKLNEFPPVGIGWCHAPETIDNYPECDVAECEEIPEYEIYFVPDPDPYWYYMCLTHKDYFAIRENEQVT